MSMRACGSMKSKKDNFLSEREREREREWGYVPLAEILINLILKERKNDNFLSQSFPFEPKRERERERDL